MKKKMFYPVLTLVFLWVFSLAAHAEMQSPNYRIPTSVFSGGGAPTGSTNYQTDSTLGQPSPIGISSSSNYINHPGFWPTIKPTKPEIKRKAMPWIQLLLLDD